MTGPEHFRKAELLLHNAGQTESQALAESWQRDAQVHATLALAAATALPAILAYWGDERGDSREWAEAAS